MKVSVNWVKEYTGIKISVDELVKKIGAQLGAVEEVIDLGKKYQGIVVVKVVSCEKHPDADKLSVCMVDDGGVTKHVKRDAKGHVQVVCGAPNVKAGMLAAWLPPGSRVPSTLDKDPFTLEAREIRGVVSNGMLASAHELTISDDHSGIVDLEAGKPGDDFAEVLKLNDHIIDIENKMFTHRPDLFGTLGVAREIAGIQHEKFVSPKWYQNVNKAALGTDSKSLKVSVKNNVPKLVARFIAIPMEITSNGTSPLWLQSYLSRVGIRPISLSVDITNYMMHLTGQPMHAYDADKLPKAGSLETRLSKKGEKLKLLGGKEVTFADDNTILITSGDVPVGIGGVMGGADTEVDENTKRIVLEVANFDMYTIRKTAMQYGLFTDAVTRFTKGQSPLQNDYAAAQAVTLFRQLGGAKVIGEMVDVHRTLDEPESVRVTPAFINERLGVSLSAKQITALLENVEFRVRPIGKQLAVKPPFWRTDIEIPEDIVEEVGRLYGYDHLPIELPKRSIKAAARDEKFSFKTRLREIMSDAGANEVLTYSFVHGDLLENVGQDPAQAFRLSNAISPDLQYYRMSLTPGLLDKVHPNIKAGVEEFAIFEIGKAHDKNSKDEEGLPKEHENLALVVSTSEKVKRAGAAYYQAKLYLDILATELGVELRYEPVDSEAPLQPGKPFDPKRSARVYLKGAERPLGMIGEYKSNVRRALKLPVYTAGFEVGINALIQAASSKRYMPLSRFPKVEQDITLKVSRTMPYQELKDKISEAIFELVDFQTMPVAWGPRDIYQKESDDHKHVTYRFYVTSMERTLKAEEINELLNKIAAHAGLERI